MFNNYGLLSVYFLFVVTVVQCSADCTVSVIPPSLCGTTEVSVPMCSAISGLQNCTDLTVHRASDNSTTVITDVESYLTELATNCTAPIQLVVMSSQMTTILAEQVLLSTTVLARAIVQLTEQLGWRQITIIADVSDTYFLRTAEQVYRTANSTSDFNFLQLGSGNSEIEGTVRKIEQLNLRIIILSVRPSIGFKLLSIAQERNLVWPEYAWIVHSVDINADVFEDILLEGVITVQVKNALSYSNKPPDVNYLLKTGSLRSNVDTRTEFYGLDSCHLSNGTLQAVVYQQIENESVLIFSYDGISTTVAANTSVPSDLPPQYSPTFFIGLFYTCITVCFVVITLTLVLYMYFRNEPTVKASSVSLSILVFIGCYLMMLYLYVFNSRLLPTFHMQSIKLQNCVCILISCLNGLGLPVALILSTLLVKLLRVYRIFNTHGKVSKFTNSNFSLAVYVLIIASPDAVVCLIWVASDPYTSMVSYSIRDGFLHVSVLCSSTYAIRWLLILLIYLTIIAVLLITFSVLTRKIKYKDFKDTKKVSVLSFLLVFTGACTLSYWYLLVIIKADVILIHSALQFGHYCVIMECVGFIFAPKLFPVLKDRLLRK